MQKLTSASNTSVVEAVVDAYHDLLYVIGWSEIAPQRVMEAINSPCVGFHGTLLPRHRGRAPIPWAIIDGLSQTGMTMYHLTEGADNGNILAQRAFEEHRGKRFSF